MKLKHYIAALQEFAKINEDMEVVIEDDEDKCLSSPVDFPCVGIYNKETNQFFSKDSLGTCAEIYRGLGISVTGVDAVCLN